MSFARPELIWLIFALPALTTLSILGFYRRRSRAAQALADSGLLPRIGGAALTTPSTTHLSLIVPAALLIGLAAAGPEWGTEVVESRSRSLDIVLVLDVSKSMLAQDLEPSRLERMRFVSSHLVHELAGDRIGLVVFAGRAYTLSPLTTDHSALQLYIAALDPEIVSQGGSSLASAITRGAELVRGDGAEAHDRLLIIASDGEALEDYESVRSAIRSAAQDGITIHAIGFGTTSGAPIPESDPAGLSFTYKRHPDTDEIVITRLEEELLQEAANATNGRYLRSGQPGATTTILNQVRDLRRRSAEGGTRELPRDRATWPIAFALALIATDSLLARRRSAQIARKSRGQRSSAHNGESEDQQQSTHPTDRPHRRTMLIAIMVSAPLLVGYGFGDIERGNRLYREGRYNEAVEAYQAAIQAGKESPALHYNLGTALLRLGRYDEAETHLRSALHSGEPEERARPLYNLGNRFLEEGTASSVPDQRRRLLDQAIAAYREVLRADPNDRDAKWNLELALRETERQPEPQSDDQGGQPDPQHGGETGSDSIGSGQSQYPPDNNHSGSSQDQRTRDQTGSGDLSLEEAEQILNAIEQDERQLLRSRLRKGDRDTPVARDW